MVLILDGNIEIGAFVSSNLSYLTCLRRLNRSRAATNLLSLSEITLKKDETLKNTFDFVDNEMRRFDQMRQDKTQWDKIRLNETR